MDILKSWWRELLIAILLVIIFALFSYKETTVKEITVEKVVEKVVEVKVKEYIEVKQQQKQRIVRKTTKTPEGTEVTDETIETDTQEEAVVDKESQSKESERIEQKSTEVSTVGNEKRYQLGVVVSPSINITEFGISGGMRVIGPLFVIGSVHANVTAPLSMPKFWLGVSYEF